MRFVFIWLSLWGSIGFLSGPLFAQSSDNPCVTQAPQHIVVLGSSTAAGVGPTLPENTWVNRYRSTLQALHPGYQVTNLARGGYRTYHLMPSSYLPPAGQPAPDTNRNITRALSLAPDAILINLPSNDAAVGIDAAEQMVNFRLMVDSAAAQGVPIWICTPQPRMFGNAQVNIQLALRDSIFAAFGSKAIDFWSDFADAQGQLLALYDSGDGVHLNDLGHEKLWLQVKTARVPDSSYRLPSSPDYAPLALDLSADCGLQRTPLRLRWANLGLSDHQPVTLEIIAQSDSQTNVQTWTLPALSSCRQADTSLLIDLSELDQWTLQLRLQATTDSLPDNDTLSRSWTLLGTSAPLVTDETVCWGDSTTLLAIPPPQESLRWYATAQDSTWLGEQAFLSLPALAGDTTLWVATYHDSLLRRDSLQTPDQHDRDWNGIMVDLVANVALTLDTLYLAVNQTGTQVLRIYRHAGSYRGHEATPADWQLWDTVAFTVNSTNDWQALPLDALSLPPGDTVGLYLYLANASHRLRYQAVTTLQQFGNEHLRLITGTGISHTFGQAYFPRQLNAAFSYRYAIGPCESDRLPVRVTVVDPRFSLGPDTTLQTGDTLRLPGPDADGYQWSTGDTTPTLVLPIEGPAPDTLTLSLSTLMSPGCQASDTLTLWITPNTTSAPLDKRTFPLRIWVNAERQIIIQGLQQRPLRLMLFDGLGRLIHQWPGEGLEASYLLPSIPAGYYWLRIEGKGTNSYPAKVIRVK